MTDLVQHANNTANSPLLANTLTLLAEITAPHNPASLLLPTAALVKLATASAAVLPDAAAPVDGDAHAGMNSAFDMQQGGGLHPGPELQAAYEGACTLLTNLSMKWGSSSCKGAALAPHLLAAMHKCLSAVSLLSSRSLASGYLAAACKFVTVTGQLLADVLAATSISSADDAAAKPAVKDLSTAGQNGSRQQEFRSITKVKKATVAAGMNDKPFARSGRQQLQATTASTAGQHGTVPPDLAQQQTQVDNMLFLMESVLQHLVPTASALLTAASCELAAASQQQQQQHEGAIFVQLLQAVQGVLMMVLTPGRSSCVSPCSTCSTTACAVQCDQPHTCQHSEHSTVQSSLCAVTVELSVLVTTNGTWQLQRGLTKACWRFCFTLDPHSNN